MVRTENPRVGGSIPSLATIIKLKFLGRKRENPSPFKEIGGFVV